MLQRQARLPRQKGGVLERLERLSELIHMNKECDHLVQDTDNPHHERQCGPGQRQPPPDIGLFCILATSLK